MDRRRRPVARSADDDVVTVADAAEARAWLADAFRLSPWARTVFGEHRTFVPINEAADLMGRTVSELVTLARRGIVRARMVGDVIEIEPVILSGPGAIVKDADANDEIINS